VPNGGRNRWLRAMGPGRPCGFGTMAPILLTHPPWT
jgi:hypothetical protein